MELMSAPMRDLIGVMLQILGMTYFVNLLQVFNT